MSLQRVALISLVVLVLGIAVGFGIGFAKYGKLSNPNEQIGKVNSTSSVPEAIKETKYIGGIITEAASSYIRISTYNDLKINITSETVLSGKNIDSKDDLKIDQVVMLSLKDVIGDKKEIDAVGIEVQGSVSSSSPTSTKPVIPSNNANTDPAKNIGPSYVTTTTVP